MPHVPATLLTVDMLITAYLTFTRKEGIQLRASPPKTPRETNPGLLFFKLKLHGIPRLVIAALAAALARGPPFFVTRCDFFSFV